MMTALNIAHRGVRSIAPENTLVAAARALAVGADLWETDIAVTRDGALILHHDDTLLRTTDAAKRFPELSPWQVNDLTLAQIRTLDAGAFFLADDPFGTIASGDVTRREAEAFVGAAVPTLNEALRFTKDNQWRINLEIKPLSASMAGFPVVQRVLETISEVGISGDQVALSSFDHSLLHQANDRRGQIPGALEIDALFDAEPPEGFPKADRFDAFNLNHEAVPLHRITELTAQGVRINLFTVNETSRMCQYIDAGVSGIFTDYPQRLHSAIAKVQKYKQV